MQNSITDIKLCFQVCMGGYFFHMMPYVFALPWLPKLRYVFNICGCHGVPIIRVTLGTWIKCIIQHSELKTKRANVSKEQKKAPSSLRVQYSSPFQTAFHSGEEHPGHWGDALGYFCETLFRVTELGENSRPWSPILALTQNSNSVFLKMSPIPMWLCIIHRTTRINGLLMFLIKWKHLCIFTALYEESAFILMSAFDVTTLCGW